MQNNSVPITAPMMMPAKAPDESLMPPLSAGSETDGQELAVQLVHALWTSTVATCKSVVKQASAKQFSNGAPTTFWQTQVGSRTSHCNLCASFVAHRREHGGSLSRKN